MTDATDTSQTCRVVWKKKLVKVTLFLRQSRFHLLQYKWWRQQISTRVCSLFRLVTVLPPLRSRILSADGSQSGQKVSNIKSSDRRCTAQVNSGWRSAPTRNQDAAVTLGLKCVRCFQIWKKHRSSWRLAETSVQTATQPASSKKLKLLRRHCSWQRR
jgi:hypothetical protein